jgi:predicted hydrocarbon binding protein
LSQPITIAGTSSNNLGQVILLGVEEIIGHSQTQSLINSNVIDDEISQGNRAGKEHDFSLLDLSRMQMNLEKVFGSAAGRGLAIRSGRASFQYILRKFGDELGLSGNGFKFLSASKRFNVGLVALAGLINRDLGDCIQLEKIDGDVIWQIDYSRFPAIQIQRSICHLVVGLLQEALYWFSGGKHFPIEEITCSEQGNPACILRIRSYPIN